jgi:hypothetical protein
VKLAIAWVISHGVGVGLLFFKIVSVPSLGDTSLGGDWCCSSTRQQSSSCSSTLDQWNVLNFFFDHASLGPQVLGGYQDLNLVSVYWMTFN